MLSALIRKCNTHGIALTGLFTAVPSALTLIFSQLAKNAIRAHYPVEADGVDYVINSAVAAARVALVPALFAAYTGMPKGVGEDASIPAGKKE